MSRSSQPRGLSDGAEEFLRTNAVKVNVCRHCHRNDGYKREVIGTYGMFDELELYRYTLLDGSTADECVQYTIWSSGPIIWLGLTWKNTGFWWPEDQMKEE